MSEPEKRIKSYRDLKVWQKSLQLCLAIYRRTKSFPRDELYGLVSQMRRASLSIPSNVAEGVGRRTRKEYARYVNIAMGSLFELQTCLVVAKELGYLGQTDARSLYSDSREIERMMSALAAKLAQTKS